MEIAEAIAIIILIAAILVLIYYYIQSNPKAFESIRGRVPINADADINNFFRGNKESEEDDIIDDEDDKGMGQKIKVKLSDIDMSSFNTDAFSKKIDAFLDHKSDELIKEWSLATTDDLDDLESKFDSTVSRVDALDDEFKKFKENSAEFQKTTESKLAEIDKRLTDLENK
ncbi:MAG: hypothetical protein Q4P18_00675 [Methanobrevibacter sp.]|uniref:hypothetical protein n=1 Tax=Methanobrevibacter sp. TaxID=66852 RepID=UPI0026DEC864|nr:hypothetical protein [Methanobrevibacter sp.]MDO5848035.1 hypothetical protein [Methanobrevibacter sp.]